MREEFDIQGLFYQIDNLKFRKYLDIKQRQSNLSIPDLMVVMMNPGSSYPLDGNENNDAASEAVPDNTQDQIMKVMLNSRFEYARVLNLSDLRTPKSEKLYTFLRSNESEEIPHSIFSLNREIDFRSLYIQGVPVIYGWGVNEVLTDLARMAIEKINYPNPIGVRKEGSEYAYYHPLPRIYEKQVEWVKNISSMLNAYNH